MTLKLKNKKLLTPVLLLTILFGLQACEISENELYVDCNTTDWEAVGYADGSTGSDKISEHEDQCFFNGEGQVDSYIYNVGLLQGLSDNFCTYNRGVSDGRFGTEHELCLDFKAYVDGFDDGDQYCTSDYAFEAAKDKTVSYNLNYCPQYQHTKLQSAMSDGYLVSKHKSSIEILKLKKQDLLDNLRKPHLSNIQKASLLIKVDDVDDKIDSIKTKISAIEFSYN